MKAQVPCLPQHKSLSGEHLYIITIYIHLSLEIRLSHVHMELQQLSIRKV
jgi:hypothetical protein